MISAEFSCGGVVVDKNKILIISTKTLRNKKVWTFPKGHIELNESPHQAALREVEEETGYRCRVVKPLLQVKYCFVLKQAIVKKTVQWYLMHKIARKGKPDPNEIIEARWVSCRKAKEMLKYPSDKKLIEIVEEIIKIQMLEKPFY